MKNSGATRPAGYSNRRKLNALLKNPGLSPLSIRPKCL